jgi:hypothetical protein
MIAGNPDTSRRVAARVIAEVCVASIGAACLAAAVIANQRWLDTHFLPSWFLPRHWYELIAIVVRVLLVVAGLVLSVFARRRIGEFAARTPAQALSIAIAAALALALSEPVLRHVHLGPTEWLFPDEEPLRQPDQRLGWTLVPARTGHTTNGGRVVDYALDTAGYRVRRSDVPVDVEQPTIVFAGESVMFGEGLTWEESVPAQVESMLGVQSANLAVHGFASDQVYLRLERELPRFRRPVAVVTLFMTALFGRNLDEERPHLGPGLVWLPAAHRWRLESLARLIVPYHGEEVVDRGIAVTREVLRATVALARARGATPVILVPQFGREEPAEEALRRRILDDADGPYLLVQIDAAWRLPWNRHPNPRAARALAAAIAERLRPLPTASDHASLYQSSWISSGKSE